jgi:hypothetical protein
MLPFLPIRRSRFVMFDTNHAMYAVATAVSW